MKAIGTIYQFYQENSMKRGINTGTYPKNEFEGTFFSRSILNLDDYTTAEGDNGFFDIYSDNCGKFASRSIPAFFTMVTLFVTQIIEVIALYVASAFIVLGAVIEFASAKEEDQDLDDFKMGLKHYGEMLGEAGKAIFTLSIVPIKWITPPQDD